VEIRTKEYLLSNPKCKKVRFIKQIDN
jgi:hypothetical protein